MIIDLHIFGLTLIEKLFELEKFLNTNKITDNNILFKIPLFELSNFINIENKILHSQKVSKKIKNFLNHFV